MDGSCTAISMVWTEQCASDFLVESCLLAYGLKLVIARSGFGSHRASVNTCQQIEPNSDSGE